MAPIGRGIEASPAAVEGREGGRDVELDSTHSVGPAISHLLLVEDEPFERDERGGATLDISTSCPQPLVVWMGCMPGQRKVETAQRVVVRGELARARPPPFSLPPSALSVLSGRQRW